jgi:hypothetical protein
VDDPKCVRGDRFAEDDEKNDINVEDEEFEPDDLENLVLLDNDDVDHEEIVMGDILDFPEPMDEDDD